MGKGTLCTVLGAGDIKNSKKFMKVYKKDLQNDLKYVKLNKWCENIW
jgi:hypothetical protein